MRNWIKIHLPRLPSLSSVINEEVSLSFTLTLTRVSGNQQTYFENKIIISLQGKTRYLLFLALKGYSFFQTMTDQLITVSLYSYVLAYLLLRNTKLLLKGNQTFTLHGSRACSDNCLLIRTDYGTKQENFFQMWRRSPQRFFVSVLCFVVVDRGAVFENGIDKQENREERTANFGYGKPHQDRITADDCPQQ